jgi:DNA ligase-1
MNSKEIFEVIEQIAANPSKDAKVALIQAHSIHPDFVSVLDYAYNPFMNYGVRETSLAQVSEGRGDGVFTIDTLTMLRDLNVRELSGTAAIEAIQNASIAMDAGSAQLLRRILLKDLRAGFGENTINKAIPGTIPDFPYMRCSLPDDTNLDEWDWSGGVISQEKADGMFMNVNRDSVSNVWATTRQGTPVPMERLPALHAAMVDTLVSNTQTHGEVLVLGPTGEVCPREIGNGILNSVLQGGELEAGHQVIFQAWDQIPLSAVVPKGKYVVPYEKRLAHLVMQIKAGSFLIGLVPTKLVHSRKEADAHCAELIRRGKEGTVLKKRTAIWKDGTSNEQIKFKLEVDVDLEIVGFLPGKGKNAATFGSVLTRTSCGQLEVAVSGFSDEARLKIHNERDSTMGKIMAVRSNQIMRPSKKGKLYSLFLPRCIEIREDKTVADSLEQVEAQFRNAVGAL